MKRLILSTLVVFVALSNLFAQSTNFMMHHVLPEQAGLDYRPFAYVDSAINNAIEEGTIPGAVLAVVRHNKIGYLKAYGNKSIIPTTAPMTTETVFDLASLSKPLGTGISIMMLLERGQIRLQDPVSYYLPEWSQDDKITIRHLLTHTSGLPSYAPVGDLLKNGEGATPREKLQNYIATCKRHSEPGEKYVYSCLNFVTLQYILEKVTGISLSEFVQNNIVAPMELNHTGYRPTGDELALCAPTEVTKDNKPLLGEVHDPIARLLNGGISGNAGLFSNAEDIAAICSMLLSEGKYHGRYILSPATVKAFTTVPRGYEEFGRTLGWNSNVNYAYNTGDLASPEAYCHTGYTGTSVVIDPKEDLAIILLTNRVHPKDNTSTGRLFSTVATMVYSAVRSDKEFGKFPDYYFIRAARFEAQEPQEVDVLMLGDSITEGAYEWEKHFEKTDKTFLNRGISGDTTKGIIHRIEEVKRHKAKQLFLLIGINDMAQDVPQKEIVDNIIYILQDLHNAMPETKLYVQTVLPIDESFNRYKGLIGKTFLVNWMNIDIRKIPKTLPYVTVVDLYPHFTVKNGNTLERSITRDGLHLTKDGYKIWTKVLEDYLD